jgi:ADP-heptose:LPS heptosyltransferase
MHTFDASFDVDYGSFEDTAAVMHHLDLVLTIATSIAHLAGALGVPVWVMLPHMPDWRWMHDRQYSPWYPTMQLFRQYTSGNWPEIMQQIKQEIKNKE